MNKLNANDRTILERVANGPAVYTYAPNGNKVKLIRSSLSVSLKKKLEDFAVKGLVARSHSGDPTGCPPEMSITFTITALGRDELDIHAAVQPPKHFTEAASDSKLLAESQGVQ